MKVVTRTVVDKRPYSAACYMYVEFISFCGMHFLMLLSWKGDVV